MRALFILSVAFFPFSFASLMQFALITSDVASEKFYGGKTVAHKVGVVRCVCIPWSFITTQWEHAIRERFKVLCGFSSRFQPLEMRFVFACLLASAAVFVHLISMKFVCFIWFTNIIGNWRFITRSCARFPYAATECLCVLVCVSVCQCQSDKIEKIYSLSLLCSPIVRWHFFPIALQFMSIFCMLFGCLFVCSAADICQTQDN